MSEKILFQCDYNEGAHPKVLERLIATNMEQTVGYGEDPYCSAAASKIREICGNENLAVHFLVGGTQTNMTVIDAALRSHQGVLCANTGHINVHETGAVESGAEGGVVDNVQNDVAQLDLVNRVFSGKGDGIHAGNVCHVVGVVGTGDIQCVLGKLRADRAKVGSGFGIGAKKILGVENGVFVLQCG